MKKSLLFAGACAIFVLPGMLAISGTAARADGPSGPLVGHVKITPAADYTPEEIKNLGQGVVFPYDYLESVLAANVSTGGEVNYGKIKGNNNLEIFVRAVALADLSQFPHWTIPADPQVVKSVAREDRRPETAFWINAYNGLFLKAVADAYPVSSVGQIPGLDTAKTRIVAGKAYSFADLRKKIAAEFDKRALFALQNGTKGGPRARPVAARYSSLTDFLDQSVSSYLLDPVNVGSFSVGTSSGSIAATTWLQSIDEYFKGPGNRQKWAGIRYVLVNYYKSGSDRKFFLTYPDYEIKFTEADISINDWTTR